MSLMACVKVRGSLAALLYRRFPAIFLPQAPGAGYVTTQEIDRRVLGEFTEAIGREGVAEVIESLLGDLKDRLQDYRSGLEAGQLDLVRRSVHSLKSSVAYVGGLGFSELCRRLELLAADGKSSELAAAQAGFESRLVQLEIELRVLLASYRS
jgi:HPt (histidine-containing phosphotransfer) domain-containing protein